MNLVLLAWIILPESQEAVSGSSAPYLQANEYVKTNILANSIARYKNFVLVHVGKAIFFYNPITMTFDSVIIMKKVPKYLAISRRNNEERIVAHFTGEDSRFGEWLYGNVHEHLPKARAEVSYVGLCGNLPVLKSCIPPVDTIRFGGLKYYLKGDTLMVSYAVDTASRMFVEFETPGIVSFLSKDTIYTYDGRLMVRTDGQFEQIAKANVFGYAYRSDDFIVVWNLEDSLYYLDDELNVVKVEMGEPMGEVRFDLNGRVRWCPQGIDKCRLIYRSRFVAFPSLLD